MLGTFEVVDLWREEADMERRLSLAAMTAALGLAVVACAQPRDRRPPSPDGVTGTRAGSPSATTGTADAMARPEEAADPMAFAEAEQGGQLIIGQDQEPDTLYRYGSDMLAASRIQSALYDGPIESMNGGYQPVLIETLPTIDNGGARLDRVSVAPGEPYVDAATGAVVTATQAEPGEDLPQLTVSFKLVDDLAWEDGKLVTAEDSVFAQQLACDPLTPVGKDLCDRTAGYTAVDDRAVEWKGLPGYTDQTYFTHFYAPLPRHQQGAGGRPMAEMTPDAILGDPELNRKPLSYGPFKIDDWVAGERLVLLRNPSYWRAGEGLPFLDSVEYRFIPESDALLDALVAGEIDVALGLTGEQVDALADAEKSGEVKASVLDGSAWELIAFNLDPVDADAHVPFGACRALRQAIAFGTDRSEMAAMLGQDQTTVMHSFLPPEHWAYPPADGLMEYDYDPQRAASLLDGLGFTDDDGSPNTPRRASKAITCTILTGTEGRSKAQEIPAGTELVLTLDTTEGNPLRERITLLFQENMQRIGVGVNLAYRPAAALLGKGPEGLVAGRRFDLAQFAWPNDAEPPVDLFRCSEIPSEANAWSGLNPTGWCDLAYDRASWQAEMTLDREQSLSSYHTAGRIFSENLPVLPLFARTKVLGTRPGVVNVAPNPTINSETWNIEAWGFEKGSMRP
jgi:peptide/nickel transport system substrate-binding protein